MTSLVDPFGRRVEYLRLSVIDRCDFRCFYCIPKGFKGFTDTGNRLTLDEMIRLVRIFSEMGVSKVRLTGGEPLVRGDIVEMTRRLSALAGIEDLSMSTNASRLAQYAAPLKEAGVSRLNVSLDTLNPDTFREITQSELAPVLEGLAEAGRLGFQPIKINMVVMRDFNLGEIGRMVDYCLENGFALRFIETMPVGEAGKEARERYVSLESVQAMLNAKYDLEPSAMKGAGPAKYLRVKDTDLRIGFITPMSQHFCANCNRVRLSSEGTLYLCLGQQDKLELRPLMRDGSTDEQLKEAIAGAVRRKPEKHEFNSKPDQVVRVMSMTGG